MLQAGRTVRPARAAASKASRIAKAPVVCRQRRHAVQVQAFFNFGGPKVAASSPKAKELVDELLTVVGTGKAAPAAKVSELVSQLQPLSVKSPVRSKLLFGTFELVYSSKPLAGSKQVLEEPDLIREVSESKTLGLLPSTSTQSGELNGLSNDTYEEAFDTLEVKSPLGGNETRAVDVVREVTVLYLDNTLRVVRIKGEKEGPEGVLAVYQRVVEGEEEEEEEEEEQGGRSPVPMLPLFGGGSREGTATIAERQVRRKMEEQQAAKSGPRLPTISLPTGPIGTMSVRGSRSPSPAPTNARSGTVSVKPGTMSVRAGNKGGTMSTKTGPSPAEKARAEREAAAAKAKAEKEAALARERAEAEKRAAAERQAAIKALLADLSDQLKEAQADSRDAAKEVKDLERANGVTLKQVASARLQLRSAADSVSAAEEDISQASAARAAAESAVKQALAELNAAQGKLRAAAGRK